MTIPISVVIPTYNRVSYLHECLDSVFGQTLLPYEVIVVDDGSTDDTETLCRHVRPEVCYLHQEHQGVSAARNRGIKAAQSEWLAFLDSDDLWHPEKLAMQWDYLQRNPQIKIFQTEEIWIRKGRRVNPRQKHKKPSGWIFEPCIPLCLVSPSAVMIHRDVFNKVGLFDESLPACEDYDLWLRAALHFEIHTLARALTIKRGGHADQLSRQWGLDRYRIRALQKVLHSESLSIPQRRLVAADIRRRAQILVNGFSKRGNQVELSYYQALLSRFGNAIGTDGINGLREGEESKLIAKGLG